MVLMYILAGLGLVVLGIIAICATGNRSSRKPRDNRPPLPPRIRVDIPSPPVSHPQANNYGTTRPLPPRRSSAPATAGAMQGPAGAGCGPRGIRPAQFPCCPYDKQRNVPGGRQVIFWDSGANCYRCSRGHRFKSNGMLL